MTTDSQDDKVLEQLYKKAAKETPPAKLNSEIINYAANPNKTAETSSPVGSHFGGGWKVPLSMAASVVVVFALLVQLDQSPQELEFPPIPELSIPTEQNSIESKDDALNSQPADNQLNEEIYEAEESLDDDSSFSDEKKESDMDSNSAGALIFDKPIRTESQPSTDSTQIKRKLDNKIEQKQETSRDRYQTQPALENSNRFDELQSQSNEPATTPKAPTSTTSATKPKTNEGFSPKLVKPQTIEKKMQEPVNGSSIGNASEVSKGSVMQQRSMNKESLDRKGEKTSSDMAADTELDEADEHTETQGEFAPIAVEDWLSMIEQLVAKKDYAEAARQLEKFKQAHPKVNIEDLDAKIP